ncbi:hypothetical protein M8818_003482 [Zalaria obscura]|uniref:Uncharacterized protein n=1 Tax=Zalaria obscura TaxID=2024903 RepID=A0ACC3SGB3_9PEZI
MVSPWLRDIPMGMIVHLKGLLDDPPHAFPSSESGAFADCVISRQTAERVKDPQAENRETSGRTGGARIPCITRPWPEHLKQIAEHHDSCA